jgi:hypothetical protein
MSDVDELLQLLETKELKHFSFPKEPMELFVNPNGSEAAETIRQLQSERDSAYAKGLEDAANAAKGHADMYSSNCRHYFEKKTNVKFKFAAEACEYIERAIRALKEKVK